MSSTNLIIELEACMATHSWVNREYRRELRTHPCGAPVLRISGAFPTFTTWGRPVIKSRTQFYRAVSRPGVSSFMLSFEGTIVLNAEL